MKILVTFIILLNVSIIINFAKCYFISTTDSDDRFNGLATLCQSNNIGPFLTPARAIRVIQPGDTVFVWSDVCHEFKAYL